MPDNTTLNIKPEWKYIANSIKEQNLFANLKKKCQNRTGEGGVLFFVGN